MPRTTAADVRALAGLSSTYDVDAFIEIASAFIDDYVTCSGVSDATRLELLERIMAAHYATVSGAPTKASVSSKSIGGASTSYSRQQSGEGVEASQYSRMARDLDTTDCIDSLLRGSVGVTWLGDDLTTNG